MPPKAKSKKVVKSKPSTVVDGLSTDDMSSDQLEEHIVRLREELEREREERSYFQLERDKIREFLEISKRSLEELKAELRNGQREREEAEERHRVEITVYKQKLKNVLSEHHVTAAARKMDTVAATSLVQNQHLEAELGLRREVHNLQSDHRETERHNQNCMKELQLKHQVELLELANSYDRRIREIEEKYHKNLQAVTEAEDRKRRAEVIELEERMKSRVVSLVEDHDRALRGAEEYYCAAQRKLLEDQKLLKEELAEVTKRQTRADRELLAAQQENKHLRDSLQEAERKLPELRTQLEEHKQEMSKVKTSSARAKVVEKELRDVKVAHELLLQAFEQVEQERDELLRRQTETFLDMQQKIGLKELLLGRKMAALADGVDKTQAQLYGSLSLPASDVDPTTAGSAANKLKDIMEDKQAAIKALKGHLTRDCEKYDELQRTCKEKLQVLGIPLYDLPLLSSEQILSGENPADAT